MKFEQQTSALKLATVIAFAISACTEGIDENEDLSAVRGKNFEVWLIDQSNSNGTFGGRIHIYPGSELSRFNPSNVTASQVIDLGADAAALCLASTGANPVRPHMIFFNATASHAVIAFVASGHVLIMNADTRAPVSCLRMSVGTAGARQAHAAVPAPNDEYIVVANQNGKILERIDTNYATNTFTHVPAASLDLANCTTPNGVACQLAGVRPDNAPICPIVDSSSSYVFTTLRGGGMFVIDPRTVPMSIVAEYDSSTVHGNGCGGIEARGQMYVNSGGATAANLTEFDVYSFPLRGYAAGNAVNTPAPQVVFSDDNPGFDRDSHGIMAPKGGHKLWVLDRASNLVEVFDTHTNQRVNTIALSHPMSADPTPDLGHVLGTSKRMFLSLRGPNPLTGDPHVATGSTPGLGILQIDGNGEDGQLIAVLPIHNIDATGVERADGHGVRIREF